jgi:tetratricopeptide (TPR) repeat protein
MDALKRAEEAKRQGTQQQGAGDGGLSLEPRPGEPSPLPELSSHIESVDADLQAEAASHIPAARSSSQTAPAEPAAALSRERESARQVFAAKQPMSAPESRKGNIFAILGIGTLAGLAVAGYFWYQYEQVAAGSSLAWSGPIPTSPPTRPSPPTPITPAPVVSQTPVTASVVPPDSREAAAAEPVAVARSTSVIAPVTRARPADQSAPRKSSTNQSPGTTPAQQIAVTFGTSPLDTALAMGYSAMNRGDLDAAAIAYQEVLRSNPRQVDALLGLSAIAANRGETDRAAAGYFRVLDIDPRNPSAHVGLLGLGAAGDVNQRESRLRSLLSQQAVGSYEAGMLQFGLGNLYASQRRWSDAQQSFFSAHASDSGNPDYLYNLAVSLDHLQQRSLALRHYEAARTAAESRAASFSPRDLALRIAELSRQ